MVQRCRWSPPSMGYLPSYSVLISSPLAYITNQMCIKFDNVSPAHFYGAAINEPRNVFFLDGEAHMHFDRFRWSICATTEGSTTAYYLTKVSRMTGRSAAMVLDNKIDFRATNQIPGPIPLLNPILCNPHLAIAH